MENNENKGILTRIYNWFDRLTAKGLLGSILVAFIIIILLLSASHIPNILSRISNSLSAALYSIIVPAENATMTADKKLINSGDKFTVNFKRGDLTDGLFTVSYPCTDNISLVSVETTGNKKINCGASYYLLDNETSITIKTETTDSIVRLVLDGSFENNSDQKTDKVGVVRVTIKNDTVGIVDDVDNTPIDNNPDTNTPIYKPVTPPVQPIYYGKPDLAARILQIGLLNQGNSIITNQTQFTYQDMVGMRFEVRNDGDANTGPWMFTAALPSISTPLYVSNTQISLRPGESIIFTLGFSNLSNERTGSITIKVDPLNNVSESSEYNNTIVSSVINTSYNSNYYNDYNNGCYINGHFTYNCSYYNYDDWGYNNLNVTCYSSPSNPNVDERVRWYADVSGGDGDYNYDWTGTNGLNSSSENPTKTYTSTGSKRATVTVTDGNGDEATATCSVYVD